MEATVVFGGLFRSAASSWSHGFKVPNSKHDDTIIRQAGIFWLTATKVPKPVTATTPPTKPLGDKFTTAAKLFDFE